MKLEANKIAKELEHPNKENHVLYLILFFLIAGLSIWAITSQNNSFSFFSFKEYIRTSSPIWLSCAILSMILYILMEGLAITCACRFFGINCKVKNGISYAAADIYFSAITPSATGGQPACAYFMMKDKIPGIVVTITLLLNLMMYTISCAIIGLLSFIICPEAFSYFHLISKVAIFIGLLLQVGLATLFYLLIYHANLLEKIIKSVVKLLGRLHLMKDQAKKINIVHEKMEEYRTYAKMMKKNKKLLAKMFLLNFFQRMCKVLVTIFTFLATKGKLAKVLAIWTIENFSFMGSYCFPVPGAMGFIDYLMLDGFLNVVPKPIATNLELLSRGLSFYSCIIICGIIVVIKYLFMKRRKEK